MMESGVHWNSRCTRSCAHCRSAWRVAAPVVMRSPASTPPPCCRQDTDFSRCCGPCAVGSSSLLPAGAEIHPGSGSKVMRGAATRRRARKTKCRMSSSSLSRTCTLLQVTQSPDEWSLNGSALPPGHSRLLRIPRTPPSHSMIRYGAFHRRCDPSGVRDTTTEANQCYLIVVEL